jgi:hypothetical protein
VKDNLPSLTLLVEFLKQILSGEKKVLHINAVKLFKVPSYEEVRNFIL